MCYNLAMTRPLISVCILSHNRKADLAHTLGLLQRDPYGRLELLVADNASEDGTPELLQTEFPNVRLFTHPAKYRHRRAQHGVQGSQGRAYPGARRRLVARTGGHRPGRRTF